MLYKLRDSEGKTTFVPVTPTTMAVLGVLEKRMEQWLADNPQAVLPEDEAHILVIAQETAFQNLTDILAVDGNGNLIVIEVKRGQTPRDVIAQALEYASAVSMWDYQELNRRATQYFDAHNTEHESLLAAFQKTFEVEPGSITESQFNQGQRIFIVGEAIEPKIERTARWLIKRGIEIRCISYTCYRTGEGDLFLDFQEIVRPTDAFPSDATSTMKVSQELTEDEFIERVAEPLQSVYHGLRACVQKWANVQIGVVKTGGYIKFSAGHNFAEIYPRKDGFHVYVRREGLDVPKGQQKIVDGLTVTNKPYGWTLTHEFLIDTNTDLDAAEKLLRQSYDAVQGKM